MLEGRGMAESLDTIVLQDCVARWQQGDRDAADQLLRTAERRLEYLARKMLRQFPNVERWTDTADVLQGALLRLLNTLRKLRPESTRDFFGLAAVHIRRELLDLARRFGCRIQACPVSELAPNDSTSGDAILAAPDSAGPDQLELWCRFHEEVEALPIEEREVVGLVFYHGWTFVQIAELFQVSERTIRRRWATACVRLHEKLGSQFPEVLA